MDADDSRQLERYYRDKSKAEAKDKLVEVAQVCNCIGELLSKYGRYEDAIKEHTQEKQLCEALQDRIGEAVACRKIGEAYCALGQYSQALELQKRHLTVARECQDNLEEQRAWATIGRTYLCKADCRNLLESSMANKQAEKSFFKALEACEKVKTSVQPAEYMAMKCRVLLNIGLVYDNREDVKQSTDVISRAILVAEKHRLDTELLMCHSSLMTIWQNNRKYSQALRSCQQGIKLAQKLRDKLQEYDLLICTATIRVAIGDFVEGKHCLKKAHKLKTKGDDNKVTTMFKTVNKMQEAFQELEDEDNPNRFEHYEIFADCLAELSLYKDAIDYYLKVLTSSHLSQEKKAAIYVSLAQTYSDTRQYDSAIFYYKKELEVCQSNPEQACRTKLNIAELEELNGSRYSAVCKIYMDAFNLARKAKHVRLMMRSLKSLMVVQRLCEQWKHLEETEKTVETLKKKYNLGDPGGDGDTLDDEEEEQDSEEHSDSLQEPETAEADISLSDLTVSEESSEEEDMEERVVRCKRKRNDIARRNEKGETPLHRACIDGNLKKVKSLIDKGHPINLRDHCGWIPLHEAANHGYEAIVEVLLEKGAWINDRGGEMCGGVTPLIDAANCGNLEVMSVLMRHGASLMAKDDNGNTALDCLHLWYNTNSDQISAAEFLKYSDVETLLCNATGKNHAGANDAAAKSNNFGKHKGSKAAVKSTAYKVSTSSITKSPVSSSMAHRPSQAGSSSVRNRFKRLPDLEDELEAKEDTSAPTLTKPSFKERLVQLKEKRVLNKSAKMTRPTRDERNRNKPDNINHNSDSTTLDCEEPDVPINTRKSDSNLRDNATEAYRQVMESMRSSAQSRVESDEEKENCDDSDDEQFVTEKKSNVPYMESNVDVGDDWLIDDVGATSKPKGKKRSHEVNRMLSGNQLKSASTKPSSKLKRARYDSQPSLMSSETASLQTALSRNSGNLLDEMFGLDSDDEVSIQSPKRTQREFDSGVNNHPQVDKEGVVDVRRSDNDFWESDGDDDLLATSLMYESYVTDDSHSVFTNHINHGVVPKSNTLASLHQDCHVSSSSSSTDEPRQNSVSNSLKTSHTSIIPQNRHVISSLPSQSINLQKTNSQPVGNSSKKAASDTQVPELKKFKCSIKVNIEGKILLVPIYESDENKTMAWLAQQTAERYFSSFFVYPVLTLKTPDGIILGPSDPIGSILNSIQELHADVRAWNKQSAAERYEKVCEAFYEECQSNIKSLLQNIGRSNNRLDLNDLSLGLRPLLPIFQALDGERSLIELRLGGNRLSDSGILSLTKLLSSLTNLKVLVLDSNELTLEGFESIVSFVQAGSGLQSMTELSLSYNCLTDKAEAPVKLLLKSVQNLTCLRLGACYLTSNFFTAGLIQALKESSVTTLTLSENQFSRESISQVLKSVASSLKDLDLSHSFSSHDIEPGLDKVLHPLMGLEGGALQLLSLAGCHLTKNDTMAVNRLPVSIPSLGQLNISQNKNVDNVSLQKLFSISACTQSSLHSITARGCSVRSPLGDEFLDALKLKLQSDNPFSKVVFSCRGLTSAESDLLSQIWMGKWKEMGKVKVSGMIVDLSVFPSSMNDEGY